MMSNNTAIVFILLSIGLYYTFTSVQYQEVKDLRVEAAEYKNVLDNAEQILNLRDALQSNYASIPRAEIERLHKALPDNVDTTQLALDLDGITSRYGVSLKNVLITSPQDYIDPSLIVLPENQPPYGKSSVTFAFVSSYENFRNIIVDVEKGLRLLDIREISFTANTDVTLYEFRITADIYWLK